MSILIGLLSGIVLAILAKWQPQLGAVPAGVFAGCMLLWLGIMLNRSVYIFEPGIWQNMYAWCGNTALAEAVRNVKRTAVEWDSKGKGNVPLLSVALSDCELAQHEVALVRTALVVAQARIVVLETSEKSLQTLLHAKSVTADVNAHAATQLKRLSDAQLDAECQKANATAQADVAMASGKTPAKARRKRAPRGTPGIDYPVRAICDVCKEIHPLLVKPVQDATGSVKKQALCKPCYTHVQLLEACKV